MCSLDTDRECDLLLDDRDFLRHAIVSTLAFALLTMIEGPPFSLWKGPPWLPLVLVGFFLLLLGLFKDPYATARHMKELEENVARATEQDQHDEQHTAEHKYKALSGALGGAGAGVLPFLFQSVHIRWRSRDSICLLGYTLKCSTLFQCTHRDSAVESLGPPRDSLQPQPILCRMLHSTKTCL